MRIPEPSPGIRPHLTFKVKEAREDGQEIILQPEKQPASH
jgi:hypothetical protein